jgi:capsular polysaccharide biosynthesis protein
VDEEIHLREYLLVLVRRWWVLVGILVVTVGATWAITGLIPHIPQYEARTKLLILANVSERLLGQQEGNPKNPVELKSVPVPVLSVETLSALAAASDLLQTIIAELDLRDPATGRPWAVETLGSMMNPKVETANRGGASAAALPLLTMTVLGEEPAPLERIANKWAEVFVQKNSRLFTSEAARSYDFILAQYTESQTVVRKLREERVQFLTENPVPVVKSELELRGADLKQYQRGLLDNSVDLTLKSQEYQEITTRLNDLTVDGRWIGLQHSSDGNPAVVASTLEHTAALQAKQQLFTTQERIKQFHRAAELPQLNQRLSLKRNLLGSYISQLEEAETKTKTQSRTLEALLAEIKQQPQFLVLVKAVADPVLWQILGLNPTKDSWDRLRSLGLQTEEVNPAFTGLVQRIIDTRTTLETERERVSLLTRRLEETRSEVRSLEDELSDKEGIQLPRLQNELALAQAAYDKEQAQYATLKTQATDLRSTIRKVRVQRDEYQKLVDSYRTDVGVLTRRVTSAEHQILELDRGIAISETTLGTLAPRLQEARIAKEEQSGSIRVVEKAVEPGIPVNTYDGRRKVLLLSPVLGLFLGVVFVLLTHYPQGSEGSQRETVPPSPGASVG